MILFEDCWVKTFSDNTQEIGTDSLINLKIASWTNGNLDNIKKVSLTSLPRTATVKIPDTEYHQFDRYLANLETSGRVLPKRVARAIQVKITNSHVDSYLLYNIIRNNAYLVISPTYVKNSIQITKDMIDQWATIIITKQDFFFQINPKGKAKWEQVNT